MATYGYARVSSSDQSTDTQVQKLTAAGCQVVRTEKLSGKSREGRDQLATVLEFIGPGDVLACVKLDRLGRSTRDVLNLVHELDQKGAFLRILEPVSTAEQKCARWRRESVPVRLREKGCEAPAICLSARIETRGVIQSLGLASPSRVVFGVAFVA
jgi:Resolvase, N terminal domain